MRRDRRTLAGPALGAILMVAAGGSVHAERAWDKAASIKAAAERLAVMQRTKGATATYEFIFNCYKTHRLASAFSEALEGCIVQDYIHSKVTAAVYDQVDEETRRKLKAPSSQQLMSLMSARVVDAYRQYGIGEQDIRAFVKRIDEQGLPVFLAKRFPGSGQGGHDEPPSRDVAPPAAAPPKTD